MNVCNTPEYYTRRYSEQAVGVVPKSNPCRLFFTLPPRRRNQDEARVKTWLEYAKEETGYGKGSKVSSPSTTCEGDA
jgi:hypothetical protein